MKEKTLRVLEYNKIVGILEGKAESELGKDLARELSPLRDQEELELLQEETEEAFRILLKKGRPPLFGINDIEDYCKRAEKSGILTAYALLKVSDSLRVVRSLKSFFRELEEDKAIESRLLKSMVDGLVPLKDLEEEINRCIISEVEISDKASPSLRNIRTSIVAKNDAIKSKLNSIIHSSKYEKMLQDSLVTMRDGRYVVPIKQENKNSFPGLIHDQSASGATIFVEPMVVVELNNDLKELEIREKEEIERILLQLSALVGGSSRELISNQAVLQKLDFIFAKGKLAMDMDAIRPKLNKEGYINIKKGRHPLLDPKKVVPIDIDLSREFNSLIITGPNTGGKTVSLKTVGLLSLMAQSGLHIPADFDSEIAIFDNIYADIGDEQSIEQSLSTFSSHMTNIVDILDEVDQNSLVLFDELGAGTDPVEGAALAMAILDNLLTRRIRTIATTHYSQLKIYALTREGVRNASVEFDLESLSPTYKLLIGVPGKSNAFEISKRLGLQDYIIDKAEELISEENVEFEDVLMAIDEDRRSIEESKYKTHKLEEELTLLEEELRKEREKTRKSREKILEEARYEARDILKDAKEEADTIIKEIRRASREDKSSIHEGQRKLKKKLDGLEGELSKDIFNVKAKEPLKSVKLGQTVEVLSLGQKAVVLELPDEKGDLLVQVGIMKVTVNMDSIVSAQEEKEKTSVSTKKIIRSKANVKPEIDLRGYNVDEAILELDKYIDDAYIAGMGQAQIIHGKGTGVLREGVQDYLRQHRHIKSFRIGGFSEGGTGVTVIELK